MNSTIVPVSRSLSARLRDVIGLCKLRIGLMISLTALVGMMVAPGARPGAWQVVVLALSVLAASASAGAFNQYFEADRDHLMARTRQRAFVTGALPLTRWWLLPMAAVLVLSLAATWYYVNVAAAFFVFLGAFFYGVVYTVWLKRRSWMNIVIGGLAGSFAALAGSAAVDPHLGVIPWLFALILFLWTPPHFWSLAIANRDEYAAAGVPMLPVVVGNPRAARIVFTSTVVLLIASLLPVFFGMGAVYFVGALAGGAPFVWHAAKLARTPDRAHAMRSFFASLVQLGAVIAAACVDVAVR